MIRTTVDVDTEMATDLAMMGPAGFHTDHEVLRRRATGLIGAAGAIAVTIEVSVTVLSRN